jgi:hypothetical protein
MFLQHVFQLDGDEFQETERDFYLEPYYLQKPFLDIKHLLQVENYKWRFEAYFSEFHLLKRRK